jgi:hypothetical protein
MLTDGPFDSCDNLFHQDVTIAINASQSAPFFTAGQAVVGILMPAAWTAARIGFDVSVDGITYYTAYDSGGNYEQSAAQASSFICIPLADAIFAPFIRLKSVDNVNVAVNQAAARTLTLVTKRYLGGSS